MIPLPFPIGEKLRLSATVSLDLNTPKEIIDIFTSEVIKSVKSEKSDGQLFAGVIPFGGYIVKPFSDIDLSVASKFYALEEKAFLDGGCSFILAENNLSVGNLRELLLESEDKSKIIPLCTVTDAGDIDGGASPLAVLITAQSLGAGALCIRCESADQVVKIVSEISFAAKIPLIIDLRENEAEANALAGNFKVIENADEADCFVLVGERQEPAFYPCKALFKSEKPDEENFFLSSSAEGFCFDDDFVLSPIFSSEVFASDDIFKLEKTDCDIIQFYLPNKEYAYNLAINSYLLSKPVCFVADDEEVWIALSTIIKAQL